MNASTDQNGEPVTQNLRVAGSQSGQLANAQTSLRLLSYHTDWSNSCNCRPYRSAVMASILALPFLPSLLAASGSRSIFKIVSRIDTTSVGSNTSPASPTCSGIATTLDAMTGVPTWTAS